MKAWLIKIGVGLGAVLTILGYVFTLGTSKGKQKARQKQARDLIKESNRYHEDVDKMDDDAAIESLDDDIDSRLDRTGH